VNGCTAYSHGFNERMQPLNGRVQRANVEEVPPGGSLVKYYDASGLALGMNTTSDSPGSGISYLVSDGLGSVSEAATTGLDYFGTRYYDPQLGQFTAADPVADGLNRYGYVGGNPTTATDPSGHYQCFDDPCTRGGGGGSTTPPPPPPPPTDCHTTNSCPTTSGGGSGGDTGPHGSCKDSAYHSECSAYYDWQRKNGPRRWDALNGLREQAGGFY
jgi:RHS repeat-associated protein